MHMYATMRRTVLVAMGCIAIAAGEIIVRDGRAVSGTVAPGGHIEEHFLDRVRIESDGEVFKLVIPVSAPWAHWTLNDPPRIVVDLAQTTSRLAQAPGMFQTRLDRGPVAALRTSQFSSDPLDRRVRITLELSRMVAHEARRIGNDLVVSIPDPVERVPAALTLGPSGLVEFGAAVEWKPAASPVASLETPHAVRSTPVEGIAPAAINDPRPTPARTLREALETIVDSKRDEPLDQIRSKGLAPHGGGENAGDRGEQRADGTGASENRGIAQAAVGSPSGDRGGPAHDLNVRVEGDPVAAAQPPPAKSIEQPQPAPVVRVPSSTEQRMPDATIAEPENGTSSASSSDLSGENGRPAVSSKPKPDALRQLTKVSVDLPPTALPLEAREQNASRLLKNGIDSFLKGMQPDRAEETLARASRFYGDTGPGEQAGIMRRELLILLGRSEEVAQLISLPGAPDSSFVPCSVYRALVQEHMSRSDLTNLERLLRVWGPSYGPVLETAGLHLSLGEAFMLAGQLDEAESHILRIPGDDPASARGLLLIARAAEDAGDRARALELYRKASHTSPGPYRARALARTADLEFQAGHVTAALHGYTHLLQADPPKDEMPWGEYQLGNCNLLLGNDEAARRHYESVVEKWPESFWASFSRERLDDLKWRSGLAGAAEGQGGRR